MNSLLYGRYVQKTYGLWEAAVSCHLKLTTAWHSFFITVHVPSMITNLAKNSTNPLPSLKLKKTLESHWFQSEFHGSSHLNFHISHVKSQKMLMNVFSIPKSLLINPLLSNGNNTLISSGSHFSHPSRSGWGTAACERRNEEIKWESAVIKSGSLRKCCIIFYKSLRSSCSSLVSNLCSGDRILIHLFERQHRDLTLTCPSSFQAVPSSSINLYLATPSPPSPAHGERSASCFQRRISVKTWGFFLKCFCWCKKREVHCCNVLPMFPTFMATFMEFKV